MRDVFDISIEDLCRYYFIVTYIIISTGNEINIKTSYLNIYLSMFKFREKTRYYK